MTSWSLGNKVVLKKLRRVQKLENDQYYSKWIIFEDEENEGWMFIQESKNGQYLRVSDALKLTTDGIQLSFTPHPNTRGAYFESFVSDQLFSVILVSSN